MKTLVEHTSKLIKGSLSNLLKGKTIALGITGSVGAVECVDLARTLMRHGAEVKTVMSQMAQRIIHPYLMEWATGNPVITELTGQIEHVTLERLAHGVELRDAPVGIRRGASGCTA